MKRVFVTIAVIAGIIGVFELVRYKPRAASTAGSTQTLSSTAVSDTSATPAPPASVNKGYRNGQFTGNTVDVGYGPVQIAITINGGQITNVKFLQMPSDLEFSRQVTTTAEPALKKETIQSQTANVDLVSGATQTSQGFIQSLQSALTQAS